MFKNIHPHQGDGHSNHHHRGILKSGNVQTIDAATKRHLQSLNKKYFPDYSELVKNEASFRKEFHSYLKEAEALQIPIEDAINVHKKAVVVQARASRKDCTGGQFPWVIMLVNSSEDFSTRIFSAGAYVDGKKCMRNNAFAITGNVREAKHFKTMGDFIASAYMNGHMNGHGPMVSFEPVIFTFDSNDEKSGNFGKKFELAALRREKYLKDWKAAGFEATIPGNDKTAERTTDTPAGSHTTLVPIIMHDITNCVYYALEDGKKIELEKWLRDRGLLEREGVSNLIESLGEHRKEKDYFESLVQMMRYKKTLGCVDSRWYRVDSSTIKLLGGIATDGERKRILETPGIKNVTVCLHFGCGYLQTAMALHEFGSEINRIFDSGIANGKAREVKIARAFFSVGIQSIINAKSTRFDLTRFLNMVESVNDGKGISSDSKHFIEKLFQSGLSDTR
ncbi:MAG: hypothetical protein NT051_01230, partial [Candidatus Micrarchaeota archaeon]|nr:hypothetical protein [Candidatus Micrarchaeota archaeon]